MESFKLKALVRLHFNSEIFIHNHALIRTLKELKNVVIVLFKKNKGCKIRN